MRRKNLASKALLRVKTLKGCSNLKDKIREAEREITKENFKRKLDLENKAIAEMNRNPKHFFKYVKRLTKNKGKIGPFTDSKGKVIDKDPATILQDQYMSVLTKPLPNKKVNDPKDFFKDDEEDKPKLKEITINRVKIREAIMKTKSGGAAGPDGITIDFVKQFVDELLDPLERIFLESTEKAIYPSPWKLSYITLAKKPGKNKSKAESFRPVALTCIFEKLLETCVKSDLQDFLETFGLLNKNQHGFHKGRSCVSQLLAHCEAIFNALENNANLDVIYLDFMKAFDKSDHGVILSSCKEKGICGKLGE